MKRLNLLLACLLVAGIAFAQNSGRKEIQRETLRQKSTELKSAELKRESGKERSRKEAGLIKESPKTQDTYFNIEDYCPSIKNPRPKTMKAGDALHILDSIVTVDGSGNSFLKQEYFFNEKLWPIRTVQSVYNPETKNWDLMSEIALEWETRGDVGYLITQTDSYGDGSALRTQYTYNTQNLSDSKIVSMRENASADWVNMSKDIYGYTGSFPEPTYLEVYEWIDDAWSQTRVDTCAWDEWGRQTYFEGYIFIDGVKTGDYKEARTFLPFDFQVPEGTIIRLDNPYSYQTGLFIWNWIDGKWGPTGRDAHGWTEIDEYGTRNLTYDSNIVINPNTGEEGCYDLGSGLNCSVVTVFEWDGGRELEETYSQYTGSEWEVKSDYKYTWSKNSDNLWQAIGVGTAYNPDPMRLDSSIYVFAANKPTYHWDDMTQTFYQRWFYNSDLGVYEFTNEESRVFDNKGNETEWYIYEGIESVKTLIAKHLFKYDENNNRIETKNWLSLLIYDLETETESDTFAFYSTGKYEFVDDILVWKAIFFEQLAKETGAFDNGQGWRYDFDVSSENILAMDYFWSDFNGVYPYLYKVLFRYDLEDQGIGLDTAYKYVYYYTILEPEGEANEDLVINNQNVAKVYPNPVKDVLHVQSEQAVKQITVLDMQGRVVLQLQGNNSKVDLSALSKGNYVVRVQTDKAVSTAKIVKQ
ncbi:MAG: T9SS type A sorting domain-containing protein [Bacteroidales bacterium]|jgi:hypothetical protein|nr:T9SS type A sorting domain-containing protein [Bacteroidales bacterium]